MVEAHEDEEERGEHPQRRLELHRPKHREDAAQRERPARSRLEQRCRARRDGDGNGNGAESAECAGEQQAKVEQREQEA